MSWVKRDGSTLGILGLTKTDFTEPRSGTFTLVNRSDSKWLEGHSASFWEMLRKMGKGSHSKTNRNV